MKNEIHLSKSPNNQGAFCCCHIKNGERDLSYILLDDDGDLIFSCGKDDHGGAEDWFTVGIWHFNDGSGFGFNKVPSLKVGQAVYKVSPRGNWKREKKQ